MLPSVVFFDIGTTLLAGPALTPAKQIASRLGLDIANQKWLDQRLLTSVVADPMKLAALLVSRFCIPVQAAVKTASVVWQSQVADPVATRGGLSLLSTLRSEGIRYGFISNICFPYAAAFSSLYGSLAVSDLQFFSFHLGLTKPDLAVFQQAITAADVDPRDCVMVGDSYKNDIKPAITLGMTTVWCIHRLSKERASLKGIEYGRLPAPDMMVSSLTELNMTVLMKQATSSRPRTGSHES